MQRATILVPGSVIEPEHLCLPAAPPLAGTSGVSAAIIAAPGSTASQRPADLKSLEKTHILETLAAVNGVRKLAAERLGMSERTLRYKLAQYRLEDAGGDG
jgi:two-component system response regulator FlrC